jgi:hypothetical protein
MLFWGGENKINSNRDAALASRLLVVILEKDIRAERRR